MINDADATPLPAMPAMLTPPPHYEYRYAADALRRAAARMPRRAAKQAAECRCCHIKIHYAMLMASRHRHDEAALAPRADTYAIHTTPCHATRLGR